MRVLLAHSAYRIPGGEDRYVARVAELLAREHEVETLILENSRLTSGPATFSRMTYSRRLAGEVAERLRRFAPDVVHLHNAYPSLGPAVHIACAGRNIPLVMTVHNFRLRCPNGYMFTQGQVCTRCVEGKYVHANLHNCFASRSQAAGYSVALWLHRFVLRTDSRVSVYVAPSNFMREQLIRWGIPAARVLVVRNFTPLHDGARATPGEYGLYLGRLSSEKGLDFLFHALKEAGDPPFLVVGDGPLRTSLLELRARLGLERTRLTGYVDPQNLEEIVAAARFLAFPSLWHENAPMAALEGMALGRPLLVSDRGGLPELAPETPELVCGAADVSQWSSAIRTLMANDELCRRAGRACLDLARREFGDQAHGPALASAYEAARRMGSARAA